MENLINYKVRLTSDARNIDSSITRPTCFLLQKKSRPSILNALPFYNLNP